MPLLQLLLLLSASLISMQLEQVTFSLVVRELKK